MINAVLQWFFWRPFEDHKERNNMVMLNRASQSLSVYTHHLGILLKCKFWFRSCQVEPETLPFQQFPSKFQVSLMEFFWITSDFLLPTIFFSLSIIILYLAFLASRGILSTSLPLPQFGTCTLSSHKQVKLVKHEVLNAVCLLIPLKPITLGILSKFGSFHSSVNLN